MALNLSQQNKAAELIIQDFGGRKRRRENEGIEDKWREVDRQIALKPVKHTDPRDDAPLAEPPNQAQALEMITADMRTMLFPSGRQWFEVNGDFDEKVVEKMIEDGIVDDLDESVVQRNLDAIIHAAQSTNQETYDFRGTWDVLNAEAVKYGAFVGRVRLVRKSAITGHYRGPVSREERIPMLVPYSVKNTYLDDSRHHMSREGIMVQPSTIRVYFQSHDDVKLAAKKGKDDIHDGGWKKEQIARIKPQDKPLELLEFEGDLIFDDVMEPNVIITVDRNSGKVVRAREKREDVHNLISQAYHVEGLDTYGTSPLVKGVPIQVGLAHTYQRVLQAAIKNVKPPVRYDPNDPYLSANGGPDLSSGAVNASITDITFWPHGDVTALSNIYLVLLRQYEELTGVTSPRLGAQTKSHQTAFAVDQEITRGQTRTVDYVRSIMRGSMTSFLHVEYELLRKYMASKKVFVQQQGGWLNVKKSYLPEQVRYSVVGAAGPGEERLKQQARINALTALFNIEQVVRQLGGTPADLDLVRKELLQEAGFTDVERFFSSEQGVPGGAETLGQLPAIASGI
jgi:hypothetical protein